MLPSWYMFAVPLIAAVFWISVIEDALNGPFYATGKEKWSRLYATLMTLTTRLILVSAACLFFSIVRWVLLWI